METNCKRRGFVKGKLMPFYKALKPLSKYNGTSASTATTTTNTALNSTYVRRHDYNYLSATARQPHPSSLPSQPHKKVSIVFPAAAAENNVDDVMSREKKLNLLAEKLFGAAINADESVDMRAATYITSVQERFKLERVN